jgi:hypothetical protein
MTDNPGESKKQLHMKTIQHISTRDAIDNRMNMSNRQNKVPKPKLSTGSVTGKYPVILDDGRTIIYITDKSRESEIRSRYALRK